MRILLDTDCLVAAVLPQHEHHAAPVSELSRRRSAGHTLLTAAPALLEAFAVLTRLPAAHDAAIAACAKKGKADEILAWNVRHFSGTSDVGVTAPLGRN